MGIPMFDRSAIGKCFVVFGASVLLTACGGSGGGNTPEENVLSFPGLAVFGVSSDETPDQVQAPWLAVVNTSRSVSDADDGFLRVDTLRYEPGYTLQTEIDFRNGQIPIGGCEFADDDTGGGDGGSPPYVSGGASVVINSPAGPWAELPIGDDLQYLLRPNPGPLPAGATLSIPGGTFPSVGALPFTEPQVPVRTSPAAGATVDENTSYTWQTSSDTSSLIALDFMEYDASGTFLGYPFYCFTEDDGEFTLPDDASVTLAAQTNDIRVKYTRLARRIDVVDGVVFYQITRVGE